MKKIISALTALMLLASMSLTVLAAEFVPSAGDKPSPPLVPDPEGYIAVIIETETGEVQEYLLPYEKGGENTDLTFSLISIAEKDEAPLPEITQELEEADRDIRAAKSLAQLTEGLDKQVQKEIDLFCQGTTRKISLGNLIFCDLLDTAMIRDAISREDIPAGSRCVFIVAPTNIDKDDFLVILHQDDETKDWEVVKDTTWTQEGYLKFSVKELGPFAFLIERGGDPYDPDHPSPQTGEQQGFNMWYFLIAAVFVGAAVVFFVKAAKKRED